MIVNHSDEPFALSDPRVKEVMVERPETLGELRNMALDAADGELVITWDDDDWFDPRRMEIQADAWRRTGKANVLTCYTTCDLQTGEAFVRGCCYYVGGGCSSTVLFPRGAARYLHLERHEDGNLTKDLHAAGMLGTVDNWNQPLLYARTFHGANIWSRDFILKAGRRESRELTDRERAGLREVLGVYARHGALATDRGRTLPGEPGACRIPPLQASPGAAHHANNSPHADRPASGAPAAVGHGCRLPPSADVPAPQTRSKPPHPGRPVPLSIFAVPRPWIGEFAVIQRNAVRSWLRIADEVILLGNEPGTAEAAAELGVGHVPQLERSSQGAPLVPSVFAQGARHARHDVLAYVNADIMLFPCFRQALEQIRAHFQPRPFLMIGRRWNVSVGEELDFTVPGLVERLRSAGRAHVGNGVDYFAFVRGALGEIPPFALGRLRWDNWLPLAAGDRGVAVIDASDDVLAAHQLHGNFPPLPWRRNRRGAEAKAGPEVAANQRLWREALRGRPAARPTDVWYALSAGRVWRRTWPAAPQP